MPCPGEVRDKLIRARKIEMYPTTAQKETSRKLCLKLFRKGRKEFCHRGCFALNKETNSPVLEEHWFVEYNYHLKYDTDYK